MTSFRAHARIVAALATALVPLFGLPGWAQANGIGDVYAATRTDVVELHLASSRVVNTVPMDAAPTALAFSPDGKTLFASTGDTTVATIDIESISPGKPLAVPGHVAALAFPRGNRLAVSLIDGRSLAFVDPDTADTLPSNKLPGTADLLVADRRQTQVLAAARSGSWVAVVDPASGHVTSVNVTGKVVAIAMDRAAAVGYVVTHAPDQVLAIDLAAAVTAGARGPVAAAGVTAWHRALTDTPVAVASTAGGVVIASARRLFEADASGVRAWRTLNGPATALAATDEGQVVVAAEGTTLEAFTIDGRQTRTISLGKAGAAVALASMPRTSSLAGTAGGSSGSKPVEIEAPSTDTSPLAALPPVPALGWIGGGAAIVLCAGLLWFAGRRHRRGVPR